MLKRQRQPSPGPSSSIPLVADSADTSLTVRDSKRRRTKPPVLDGASRGWNVNFEPSNDEDDYEDDDYDTHQSSLRTPPPEDSSITDEYKSCNSLLRELHILQQHRLLMAGSPTKALQPPVPVARHALPIRRSPSSGPFSGKPHFSDPPLLQPFSSGNESPYFDAGRHDQGDESRTVHRRYGDTNKLLRELFLSRRREMTIPDIEHRS